MRAKHLYRWGISELDLARRELIQNGEVVPIQALVFRALVLFLERHGQTLSRDELLQTLWPDTVVSDTALNQLVRKARRAFGEGARLETVRGVGYRLDLAVSLAPAARHATRLVGRERERRALATALEERRLVTLLGPGGAGKTSLAQDYGDTHGVAFCDLTLATTEAGIRAALLETLRGLDSRDRNGSLQEEMTRAAQVWILDNAEHVLDPVVAVVRQLLATTELRFLVTSRHPLQLPEEHVLPVQGLGLDGGRALVIQLAEAAQHGLGAELDGQQLDGLVTHLDALPLALKLAVAQLPTLGLSELIKQLQTEPTTDTGGHRHRSMTATVGWSWSLLTVEESTWLKALTVLPGPFSMPLAALVLEVDEQEARRRVQPLIRHSLVRRDGADRYAVYEAVRQVGVGLTTEGEGLRIRRRLLDAVHALNHLDPARLRLRLDTLRHLQDYFDTRDVRRAAQAGLLIVTSFHNHERYAERVRVLQPLVARLEGVHCPERVRVFRALAIVELGRGASEAARVYAAKAVEAASHIDDQAVIWDANWAAGYVLLAAGEVGEATRACERALALADRSGDKEHQIRSLGDLARCFEYQGRFDEELRCFGRALVLARESGSVAAEMAIQGRLGVRSWRHGDLAGAHSGYQRALELALTCGDVPWQIVSHANVAQVLLVLDDGRLAAEHLERAATLDADYTKLRGMRQYVYAKVCRARGDEDAVQRFIEAGETSSSVPDPEQEAYCIAQAALTHARFGDFDAADGLLARLSRRDLNETAATELFLARGCVDLRRRDWKRAADNFERLVSALPPQETRGLAEAQVFLAIATVLGGGVPVVGAVEAALGRMEHEQLDLLDLMAALERGGALPPGTRGAAHEPTASAVAALVGA